MISVIFLLMINSPTYKTRSISYPLESLRHPECFPELLNNVNSFIDESQKVIARVNRDINRSNETLDQIAEDAQHLDVLAAVEDEAIEDLQKFQVPQFPIIGFENKNRGKSFVSSEDLQQGKSDSLMKILKSGLTQGMPKERVMALSNSDSLVSNVKEADEEDIIAKPDRALSEFTLQPLNFDYENLNLDNLIPNNKQTNEDIIVKPVRALRKFTLPSLNLDNGSLNRNSISKLKMKPRANVCQCVRADLQTECITTMRPPATICIPVPVNKCTIAPCSTETLDSTTCYWICYRLSKTQPTKVCTCKLSKIVYATSSTTEAKVDTTATTKTASTTTVPTICLPQEVIAPENICPLCSSPSKFQINAELLRQMFFQSPTTVSSTTMDAFCIPMAYQTFIRPPPTAVGSIVDNDSIGARCTCKMGRSNSKICMKKVDARNKPEFNKTGIFSKLCQLHIWPTTEKNVITSQKCSKKFTKNIHATGTTPNINMKYMRKKTTAYKSGFPGTVCVPLAYPGGPLPLVPRILQLNEDISSTNLDVGGSSQTTTTLSSTTSLSSTTCVTTPECPPATTCILVTSSTTPATQETTRSTGSTTTALPQGVTTKNSQSTASSGTRVTTTSATQVTTGPAVIKFLVLPTDPPVDTTTRRRTTRSKFFKFGQIKKVLGTNLHFGPPPPMKTTPPILWIISKTLPDLEVLTRSLSKVTKTPIWPDNSSNQDDQLMNSIRWNSNYQSEAEKFIKNDHLDSNQNLDSRNVQVFVLEPDNSIREFDVGKMPDSFKPLDVSRMVLAQKK